DLVHQHPLPLGQREDELVERGAGHEEGEDRRPARDGDHEAARRVAPHQRQQHALRQRPEQRQQDDPAQQLAGRGDVYHLSRLTSSTLTVSRLRKSAITMPRPTATSAAATTITISTNRCPPWSPQARAKPTNARFAAFSISSIDIRITIRLRRV